MLSSAARGGFDKQNFTSPHSLPVWLPKTMAHIVKNLTTHFKLALTR